MTYIMIVLLSLKEDLKSLHLFEIQMYTLNKLVNKMNYWAAILIEPTQHLNEGAIKKQDPYRLAIKVNHLIHSHKFSIEIFKKIKGFSAGIKGVIGEQFWWK